MRIIQSGREFTLYHHRGRYHFENASNMIYGIFTPPKVIYDTIYCVILHHIIWHDLIYHYFMRMILIWYTRKHGVESIRPLNLAGKKSDSLSTVHCCRPVVHCRVITAPYPHRTEAVAVVHVSYPGGDLSCTKKYGPREHVHRTSAVANKPNQIADSSNWVLLAIIIISYCFSCWASCVMPIVRSSVCSKTYAFKCCCCKTCLSSLKDVRTSSTQLHTHSGLVLSCHWGRVTVSTMIRLPEPKRVLPNSPHSWIRYFMSYDFDMISIYHIISYDMSMIYIYI